jgi:y4mF family transcriptional regulator
MDSKELGLVIKNQRKSLRLTQTEVALSCGVGLRFISDLENGKSTCQIGKALLVMDSIGLKLMFDGIFKY